MNIKQEQTFKPITITLETKEEANAFIDIIDRVDRGWSPESHELARLIDNIFTNDIKI